MSESIKVKTNSGGLRGLCSRVKYSPVIFVLLSAAYIARLFWGVDFTFLTALPYFYSALNGQLSRALVGTVISLFGEGVAQDAIEIGLIVFTFIMLALLSAFFGAIIEKYEAQTGSGLKFGAIFAMLSITVFPAFTLRFGYLDVFILILVVAACFSAKKKYAKITVPLLCVLIMAIDHRTALVYLPVVWASLPRDEKSNRTEGFVGCAVASGASFLFFSLIKYAALKHGVLNIRNVYLIDSFLERGKSLDPSSIGAADYLDSLSETVSRCFSSSALISLLIGVLVAAPAIFVLCFFYMNMLRSIDRKADKRRILLFACSPLLALWQFLYCFDTMWFSCAVLLSEFMLVFLLVASGDKSAIASAKKLGEFFDSRLFVALLCVMYMSLFTFAHRLALGNIGAYIFSKLGLIA